MVDFSTSFWDTLWPWPLFQTLLPKCHCRFFQQSVKKRGTFIQTFYSYHRIVIDNFDQYHESSAILVAKNRSCIVKTQESMYIFLADRWTLVDHMPAPQEVPTGSGHLDMMGIWRLETLVLVVFGKYIDLLPSDTVDGQYSIQLVYVCDYVYIILIDSKH